MSVPTQVVKLVEQFKEELQTVKSSEYKEAWVRKDYIDPFFKTLGWDVDHQKSGPLIFKEVIHEDSLRVEGAMKAPDYCFYTGGARRFFVEAKKPSVNLWDGRAAAFQVRRYAWSAKLPLSILTDFEELAIYDCRVRPQQEDKASTARSLYMTYEEYPDRWDEIASLFSKEAVLSGSLDSYAQELKKQRGIAPVDQEFLKEIEGWREMLAKDLAQRNPSLTRRELNYAVQMTIDRIVFLRICEDRGIEDYGTLEGLLDKDNAYDKLRDAFKEADAKYNSGLFHFKREKNRDELPDDLTLNLQLADQPLKKIINGLYYPESPYQFSVMPVEIMGQVYEQFLGKVISIAADHRVVIEEKPEVRKAGGVYYTPSYIVEYIVKNTVGKLVEGKTPRQVSKLKILDPACGSGSFLVGAYNYLVEWHREWYVNDSPDKHTKLLYEGPGGAWQLATAEKKRILLNNIYGVDLDSQAVEVTKLSLLLKVLEGETNETINNQLTLFKERALPDLDNNIKWGNSLIGPDFYENEQISFLDEEERYRINVFDWKEAFPGVFEGKNPGFDAVIGNPPYIRIQALKEFAPIEVEHYKQAYQTAAKGNYDIYVVLVEKGLTLLNQNGRLGFILPHKFFNAKYGQPLRALISEGKYLADVVHFGDEQIFTGATTYTCLLFLNKAGSQAFNFLKVDNLPAWRITGEGVEGSLPAESTTASDWNFVVGRGAELFQRLRQMPVKLGDVADRMAQGIRTSANEVYVLDLVSVNGDYITAYSKQLNQQVELEHNAVLMFLQGREIKPYRVLPSGKVAILPYRLGRRYAELIPLREIEVEFPKAFEYLNENKGYLEDREKGRFRGPGWHAYGRQQNIDLMLLPKLLVPDIADRASFALDEAGQYAFTSGYGVTLKAGVEESTKYLLGLLNSPVLDFYLKNISTTLRGGFFRYFTQYIEQLPIRTIDFSNPYDKAHHDRMVELVEQMLKLHEQLPTARTANDKNFLQRQINATDKQINRLVYELYGLTEDEIQIVEG